MKGATAEDIAYHKSLLIKHGVIIQLASGGIEWNPNKAHMIDQVNREYDSYRSMKKKS